MLSSMRIALLCGAILITVGSSPAPEDDLTWYGHHLEEVMPLDAGDGLSQISARPWDRAIFTLRGSTQQTVRRLEFTKEAGSDGKAKAFAEKRIAEISRRLGPPDFRGDGLFRMARWTFSNPAIPGGPTRVLDIGSKLKELEGPTSPGRWRTHPVIAGVIVVAIKDSVWMVVADHQSHEPPSPPPPPPTRENPLVADFSKPAVCPVPYPSRSMRAEKEGRVTALVTVNDQHAMTQCAVVSGAGAVDLDSATCMALRCQAESSQAAGKPMEAGSYEKSVVWHIN